MTSSSDTQRRGQPRGRIFYGWYIVAASIAMNFYLSVSFFLGFQVFFLPILNEFRWSRTQMSLAFMLRQLETGLLAPAVGFLVDRWGARQVILTGVLIGGAGMVFLGFISSIWMFYLAFLIISVGMSGASHGISWPVILANWFRRLRGRATAIGMLGPVIGGPFVILVVFLEEAVGWRVAIRSLGVGLGLVGIPLALLARPRPEPYGYLPDGDPPPHNEDASPSASTTDSAPLPEGGTDHPEGFSAAQAIRTRTFWVLVAIFGAHSLGISGFLVHQLPLFQGIGFSAREGAAILGLIFFLSGIGRLTSGTLMDFVDRRLVLSGVLLLQTVSYLILIAISRSLWMVVGFALIFGAAFGATIPARPILARELFGSRAFGAINGLIQGISFGSGMIGPIVMGAVFDLQDTYTPAIIGFAVLTALAIPLPLLLKTPSLQATGTSH